MGRPTGLCLPNDIARFTSVSTLAYIDFSPLMVRSNHGLDLTQPDCTRPYLHWTGQKGRLSLLLPISATMSSLLER